MTRSRFYAEFVDPQRPVILRGYASHWQWRAMDTWALPQLLRMAAASGMVVPVALSNEEVERTVKAELPLSALIEAMLIDTGAATPTRARSVRLAQYASSTVAVPAPLVPFMPPEASRAGLSGNALPYLKQWDFFRAFPQLSGDVDFKLFSWKTIGTLNAWLGPRFAVTGVHNDDENNISAQIVGVKRFLLFSPSDRPRLYINDKFDTGTECGAVRCDNPDLRRHPLYADATAHEAVLREGDALFIPRWWFHHVRSLTPTLSVNYFASTPWELLRDGFRRFVSWVLHELHLYKWGNCVCHPKAEI